MKKKLLDSALAICFKEAEFHPERNFYMHWSFIIQRNKLIKHATNTNGEAPRHFGYASRLTSSGKPKLHAEFNCYNKCKNILDPRIPFEIINVRLNRLNQIKISSPCNCCYSFLKNICNCSHCYFTTDQGIWAKTIF